MKRSLAVVVALASLALAPVARGADDAAALYKQRCSGCHGPDGAAKRMGSPDISKTKSSEADIEKVISDGRGKMTGFKGKLTPEQIKAVATYVKSGLKS